jgi:TPR repeat protein
LVRIKPFFAKSRASGATAPIKKGQANEKGTEAERDPGEAQSFFNKARRQGNQSGPIRVYPFKEGAFFLGFPDAFLAATRAPGKYFHLHIPSGRASLYPRSRCVQRRRRFAQWREFITPAEVQNPVWFWC